MNKRGRGQVNAFNLVPVVEHVLPDRPRTEVYTYYCIQPNTTFLENNNILKGAHFQFLESALFCPFLGGVHHHC